METISWNNFGEGNYETVDYITIDGVALNPDMVNMTYIKDGKLYIAFNVKHGFSKFLCTLRDLTTKPEKFAIRSSNFMGGYLIVKGEITFYGMVEYIPPNNITIAFKLVDSTIETSSPLGEEAVYMTDIKPKDGA